MRKVARQLPSREGSGKAPLEGSWPRSGLRGVWEVSKEGAPLPWQRGFLLLHFQGIRPDGTSPSQLRRATFPQESLGRRLPLGTGKAPLRGESEPFSRKRAIGRLAMGWESLPATVWLSAKLTERCFGNQNAKELLNPNKSFILISLLRYPLYCRWFPFFQHTISLTNSQY